MSTKAYNDWTILLKKKKKKKKKHTQKTLDIIIAELIKRNDPIQKFT